MNKQQEALKLALEALENAEYGDYDKKELNKAITAIREALADSALDRMAENARELGLDYEPVVERVEDSVGMGHGAWDMVDPKELAKEFHKALAEPPCKTGSQCTSKCQQCEQPAQQRPQNCGTGYCSCIECPYEQPEQQESEAVHAAWMAGYTEGEREAIEKQSAQQQEPVAWYCKEGLNQGVSLKQESPEWEPLYTTQFNFNPLTDEEADELVRRFARYELLRAIEAKLREKNA